MEGFDNKPHQDQHNAAGIADPSINPSSTSQSSSSKGSLVQDANLDEALSQALTKDASKGQNGFSFAKDTTSKFDSIDQAVDGISKSILSGNADFGQTASTVEGLRQRLKNLAKEQDDSGEAAIFQQLRGDLNQVRRALVGKNADDAQEFIKLTQKAFDAADKELSGVATGAFERNPDANRLAQLGVNINNFDFFKDKSAGNNTGSNNPGVGDVGGDDIGKPGNAPAGGGKPGDVDAGAKPGDVDAGAKPGNASAGDDKPGNVDAGAKPDGAAKGDDHNHAGDNVGKPELHVSLDNVANAKGLNVGNIGVQDSLKDSLGAKGDILDSGAGEDVVIGSGDSDVIFGSGGGINTITTGSGSDTIIFGKETTNRIFDFDPSKDKIAFADDVNLDNIVIAQGKNTAKAGVNQPLDSVNNALIIDKEEGHILGALTFTKASDLSDKNFVKLSADAIGTLDDVQANLKRGSGRQVADSGVSDRMIGGDGNDFFDVQDNSFNLNSAREGGEFPFPTPSDSTAKVDFKLQGNKLSIDGELKGLDGAVLFSQGEKEIDPKATILNGSDPKALVDGFLKVPKDVEGNPLSGVHFHFSPAGDDRGNFADATVVRFFDVDQNPNGKDATFKGRFELTDVEKAAFLAGNMYINAHTNLDVDGDGVAGFPTGENRINANKDVVKFTA